MFPLGATLSDRECELLDSVSSGTVLFAGGVGSGHSTLAKAHPSDLAGRNRKIISLSRVDGPPTTWMREMGRQDGAQATLGPDMGHKWARHEAPEVPKPARGGLRKCLPAPRNYGCGGKI